MHFRREARIVRVDRAIRARHRDRRERDRDRVKRDERRARVRPRAAKSIAELHGGDCPTRAARTAPSPNAGIRDALLSRMQPTEHARPTSHVRPRATPTLMLVRVEDESFLGLDLLDASVLRIDDAELAGAAIRRVAPHVVVLGSAVSLIESAKVWREADRQGTVVLTLTPFRVDDYTARHLRDLVHESEDARGAARH
jgi:hypothetical protein